MSNRYRNTKVITKDGINYFDKTIYKKIPQSDNDMYVITQYGDRLDMLAFKYYQDTTLWWYIAKANNLHSINVKENIQLRIPGSTEYAEGL